MSGVWVSPGATALTLTPSLAHSMAAALVSASSAPFAAAYSPIVGTPTEALREFTLTIDLGRRHPACVACTDVYLAGEPAARCVRGRGAKTSYTMFAATKDVLSATS